MNATQRDHLNAVNWIEGEIENMILELGKPNASAAATVGSGMPTDEM